MSLHIGSTDVSKLYIGNQEVEKIFLGNSQVFPEATPSGPIVVSDLTGSSTYKACNGYVITNSNGFVIQTEMEDMAVKEILSNSPYCKMYLEVKFDNGVNNSYRPFYLLCSGDDKTGFYLGKAELGTPTDKGSAFQAKTGSTDLIVTTAEVYQQLLGGRTDPNELFTTFFGVTLEGTRGGTVSLTVRNLFTGASITKSLTDTNSEFMPIRPTSTRYYTYFKSTTATNKTRACFRSNSIQMDIGNSANDILMQYRPSISDNYTTEYTAKGSPNYDGAVNVSYGLGEDDAGNTIFVPDCNYNGTWIVEAAATESQYTPVYLIEHLTSSGVITKVDFSTYKQTSTATRRCMYLGILYCEQGSTSAYFTTTKALVHIGVENDNLAANYSIITDGETVNSDYCLVSPNSSVTLQVEAQGYMGISDTQMITDYVNNFYYYLMRNNHNAPAANICVSDEGITWNTNGQIDFGDVQDPFLYLEMPFAPRSLAVNGMIMYQISFRDSGDFRMGFFENWSDEALAVDTIPEFDAGTVLARKSMPGQTGEPVNLNLNNLYSTGVAVGVMLTRTAEDSYSITIMRIYNMDSGEPTTETVWNQTYTQQDWNAIFPGGTYYFFVTPTGGSRYIEAKITGGMIQVGQTMCQWTSSNTIDVGV